MPALATRATITPQFCGALLGGSPAADQFKITWTAADASNFNDVALTGNDYLLVWNTHASTDYTVTVHTTADENGRTGDITTYNIGASTIHVLGPFKLTGFAQTNGRLNIDGSNASIKFAVLTVRGNAVYK